MRNTAIVKFNGEFVIGTAYGADPSCLGLDLYKRAKDPVSIIGASALWGIEYVRRGMTGFVYGGHTSDTPKPHRVRVIDIEDPEKEVRRMALDSIENKLTPREKQVMILRYIQNLDFASISTALKIPQDEIEQTYMGVTQRLRDCVDFERKEKFHLGVCDVEYDVLPHGDIIVRTGTSPDSIEQRTLAEILPESILGGKLNPEQATTRKLELVNRYNDILDELRKTIPGEASVLAVLRRQLNFGSRDPQTLLASHVDWRPSELGSEYLRLVTEEHKTKIGKINQGVEKLKNPVHQDFALSLRDCEQASVNKFEHAFSGKAKDDFETLANLRLDDFFSILLLETGDPFRYAPIEVLKRRYLK